LTGSRFRTSVRSHLQSPTSASPNSPKWNGFNASDVPENVILPFNHTNGNPSSKEAADWYVEGPGRRVAYDDLTAIDWIFEYAKERQRLRALLSGSFGIARTLKMLVDASQVWVVLILTGITVGFVAAAISIASDWLGDIKQGFCKTGDDGGRFYLNRQFCCWGHDGIRTRRDLKLR
jgi:chloride channel 3/4/5